MLPRIFQLGSRALAGVGFVALAIAAANTVFADQPLSAPGEVGCGCTQYDFQCFVPRGESVECSQNLTCGECNCDNDSFLCMGDT